MKKYPVFIYFILVIIFSSFITANLCTGTPICDKKNANACNNKCGCTWQIDGNSAQCVAGSCSDCTTESSCTDSGCTWDTSTDDSSDGGDTTIITEEGSIQKVIGVIPRGPLGGDTIQYGVIELKVQVYYGGNPSNIAIVKANSELFGEVNLYHEYGSENGIYKAEVTINKNTEAGKHRVTYTATQFGKFDEVSLLLGLEQNLMINMNLKEKYFKGERIIFSGEVFDLNDNPTVETSVTISGFKNNIKIFSTFAITNENGLFLSDYLTKVSDPEGVWEFQVEAVSKDKKAGILKINSVLDIQKGVNYYTVNYLSPFSNSLLRRGENVPVTVEVKENEDIVQNSGVFVFTPSGNKIKLDEAEPGIYVGNIIIDPDEPIGDWFLKAEVAKQTGDITKVGGSSLPIKIGPTEIKFDLISQSTDVIFTNSRLNIQTKLTYPDGSPVKGADTNAYLSNGNSLKLIEKSNGIYEKSYFIGLNDLGTLNVEVNAKDSNGNFGSSKYTYFVRERSAVGNVIAYSKEGAVRYWWAILLFIAISGFIYKPYIEFNLLNRRLRNTKEEQRRVKSMQIETEKKYYKEGSISKKEFNELMSKYENRISNAKESQKDLEKKIKLKINKFKSKKS